MATLLYRRLDARRLVEYDPGADTCRVVRAADVPPLMPVHPARAARLMSDARAAVADEARRNASRLRHNYRKRDLVGLLTYLMVKVQMRATAKGRPDAAQPYLDQLSQLANDPARADTVLGVKSMSWVPYEGPKGGRGWKNSETGRVVYGHGDRPGERREKQQASAKAARDILHKVSRFEATPEDLEQLATHLPALTVAKLRQARLYLGATFGRSRKQAGMAAALMEHVRARVEAERHAAANPKPVEPEPEPAALPEPPAVDQQQQQQPDPATADHSAALAAIPSGQSAWVAGHLVRRTGRHRYQVETGTGYATGDAAETAERIRGNWQLQAPEKGPAAKALVRADAYQEPDFMDNTGRADAAAKARTAVPEGARAVSLDENTRGRVGSVVRDPETGQARLRIDGGTETHATDFEPLDSAHSWRGGEKPAAKPKAPAAKTGDLLADAGPVEPSAPAPAAPSDDTYTSNGLPFRGRGELAEDRLDASHLPAIDARLATLGESVAGARQAADGEADPFRAAEHRQRADDLEGLHGKLTAAREKLGGGGTAAPQETAEPGTTPAPKPKPARKPRQKSATKADHTAVARAELAKATPEMSPDEIRTHRGDLSSAAMSSVRGRGMKAELAKRNVEAVLRPDGVVRLIPRGSKFLGAGTEAVAFKTPAGEVVRLELDRGERPDIPEVLQPAESTVVGEGDGAVRVERLPFAGKVPREQQAEAIRLLHEKLKGRGYEWTDDKSANIGVVNGEVKIIDPGNLRRVAPDHAATARAELAKATPGSHAHTALDAALGNHDDSSDQSPRSLAGHLAAAWIGTHRKGATADDLAPVERALAATGAERVGTTGETVPFRGGYHQTDAVADTGTPVRVVRPGWVHRDEKGETRLIPAAVEPAGKARTGAVSLDDPHALAAAVHTAARQIPDLWGQPFEPGRGASYRHKAGVADLYDHMTAAGSVPAGTTLDAFKSALLAAHQADTLDLGRNDLPQNVRDLDQVHRGEIAHPAGLATWHVVNTPDESPAPVPAPKPKPARKPRQKSATKADHTAVTRPKEM